MHHLLELVETEWAVVEGCRQAEPIFHEILLAGAVAAVHRVKLRHGDVALVDDEQIVVGEEVEQAVGPLSRFATVEIARIVLDARAIAQFLDHLHVVLHTFLDALRLDVVAESLKKVDLRHQVVLNLSNGLILLLFRRDEKVRGVDLIVVERGQTMVVDGVDFLDLVDFVVPPRHAQNVLGIGHKNIDMIALHTEVAALQVDVIPHIEGIYQLAQEHVPVERLSFTNGNDTLLHGRRSSHAIDA